MPVSKSPRRKASASSSMAESAISARTHAHEHHHVTKVPLAVIVLAFLFIVAIIIGTMAAGSMQRDDDMLRQDLARSQQQLSDRLTRLEALAVPTHAAPEPTPVANNALPVTVSASQLNDMHVTIDTANWNASDTTQTVEYRDTANSVLVKLPYSDKWGNSTYKVTPYELNGNILSFGPLTMNANGRFERMYTLQIGPKMSYADITAQYKLNTATVGTVKEREISIGELVARLYTLPANDTKPVQEGIVFSGKKLNYMLSRTHMEVLTPKDITQISNVIRSLRAI